MGKPISDITIVGGGTAGWLVAAFLNHRLQWGAGHGEAVRITLIEARRSPAVQTTIAWLKEAFSPETYPWFSERFVHPRDFPATGAKLVLPIG